MNALTQQGAAQRSAVADDHFALFGLPVRFQLDSVRLAAAYRQLQSQVHPDRHAGGSVTEQRLALQWATRANEAYQTLRNPLERACYLLRLRHGMVALSESAVLPANFLLQQMDWHEQLGQARRQRDGAALGQLQTLLCAERFALHGQLAVRLDVEGDAAGAAELVCKLNCIHKLITAIDEARLALE
ncbi:MAG: Fe-S protein assembly co-chaperone HscB [Pseudomonadales bacterium]|jgi:molecular chaperone HscB|nr:Fe-S protein assembly co-chaperone HscB [Pseudomonadales bacterium]MCC6529400.1 Fe-S protein assembly co-chaperone HscB [Pseudomonadales bacterium]MCP5333246.1 Fe-S protein assembly co-chaperone HscB [Pseudomonadales bacterium]HMU90696.1 Fe-S protein assembly co-chaperone HscB [Pseudomonadales bacterium]HMW15666.1 Fe-S protein assembly co-chaperone HscB [Pseudomonadales bacterium]